MRGCDTVIVFSRFDDARMQEGTLSLIQMAKIAAARALLSAARLPYISVLTDPNLRRVVIREVAGSRSCVCKSYDLILINPPYFSRVLYDQPSLLVPL